MYYVVYHKSKGFLSEHIKDGRYYRGNIGDDIVKFSTADEAKLLCDVDGKVLKRHPDIKSGQKVIIIDNSQANSKKAYENGEIFKVIHSHRDFLYIVDNFGQTRSLEPWEYELLGD